MFFLDDTNVWIIDWESASDGYMLQDAGNFIASIFKKGRMKTNCINMFMEEFIKDCSDSARGYLKSFLIPCLAPLAPQIWGEYVMKVPAPSNLPQDERPRVAVRRKRPTQASEINSEVADLGMREWGRPFVPSPKLGRGREGQGI